MQFITNKIEVGRNKTWEEFTSDIIKKKGVVKIASTDTEEEIVKTAQDTDEGKDSGQPKAEEKIINDDIKRDDIPAKGSSVKKEEGPSSGQPEAEAKLVNKPEVDKKAEKEVEKTVEEEEDDKEEDDKEEDDKEEDDKEEDDKEENKEKKDDGHGLTDAQKEKLPEALQKAIQNKKSDGDVKYIKVSNLDPKSKKFLNDYYNKLWPKAFVDALLADK